jgi:polyisoprenoid-binding protein YceI
MRFAALLAAMAVACGANAAVDKYKVDADHAQVLFVANHMGFSKTYGWFTKLSGDFELDEANPSASKINLVIDANSLTTAVPKKDQHLKSPDFLDTKQFPKITFKSDTVKKVNDKNYEIAGQLTLHGVTKPVTMKFERMKTGEDPWKNTRTGGEGRMTIKRSDYGVKYMLEGIPDEVEIIASLEGIKQK